MEIADLGVPGGPKINNLRSALKPTPTEDNQCRRKQIRGSDSGQSSSDPMVFRHHLGGRPSIRRLSSYEPADRRVSLTYDEGVERWCEIHVDVGTAGAFVTIAHSSGEPFCS